MSHGRPPRGDADADADADAQQQPSTSYPTDGPLHLRATCNGHTKAVSRVRFAPDSQQLLASASADQSLRLWRLPDGAAVHAKGGGSKRSPEQQQQQQHQHQQQPAAAKQQQTMRHAAGINDVAWNPAGSYLATASDDLTACIWDAESGRCLSTLAGHTNYVFCCQFNPAGNMLATGSFDETVRFWDVRSGRCLRELPAHSDPVTAMDFSYDGTVLASCSFDGLLRLWDTATGHCLKTLAIDNGDHPLSCVAFSPNGQYLLQSCLNSKMRLVSYSSGCIVKTYKGHANTKFCCISTFLPGLPHRPPAVASGSEDGAIFMWDVNSKQVLQHIPPRKAPTDAGAGHCGAVLCVAAAVRGGEQLMASAAHEPDCAVKIWSSADEMQG